VEWYEKAKQYLRDNCDYSFETLKINMPLAMWSVHISTIRKWEHHIHRWMEAYRDELSVTEAQILYASNNSVQQDTSPIDTLQKELDHLLVFKGGVQATRQIGQVVGGNFWKET
jgi:hypothetical protein